MSAVQDAPLNTLPEGLLDLLGIKSFGAYPNRLEGRVQPSIDLLQSYLAANSLETSINLINTGSGGPAPLNIAATNPVDIGDGTQVIVPQGQVWWIQHFGVRWNIPADALNYGAFAPAISMGGTGTPMTTVSGGFTQGSGTAVRGGWACIERPVIARPGSILQIYSAGTNVVASNITLTGSLRIARLRV
jgi:hypothetical protein